MSPAVLSAVSDTMPIMVHGLGFDAESLQSLTIRELVSLARVSLAGHDSGEHPLEDEYVRVFRRLVRRALAPGVGL